MKYLRNTAAVVLATSVLLGFSGSDAEARRHRKLPTETPVLFTAIQPEAETAASIVSIHMSVGTGDLVIQTTAGSLSPLLETEKSSVTRNQVKITFPNARLDETYKPSSQQLLADFRQAIPVIQEVTLGQVGNGIVLTIESNKPISPKVVSNTGSLVTLDLGLPHREAPKVVDETVAQKRALQAAAASPKTPTETRLTQSDRNSVSPLSGIFSQADLLQRPQTDGSVRQVWMEFESGNSISVVLNLKTFVDKNPNDKIARYLLAVAALSSPSAVDKEMGEKELKTVLTQDPQFSLALLEWIQLRYQQAPLVEAQYKEISSLLQKIETQYPQAPALKYGRAMLEAAKNNTAPMTALVEEKLLSEPTNAALYVQLGDLYTLARKPSNAGAQYVRALSLLPKESPEAAAVLFKLADVYQKTVSDRKALEYYAQAISPEQLLRYAELLKQANRSDDALLLINTAQLALGNSVDRDKTILFGTGKLYWDMKQPQLALKNLKRFMELSQPSKSATRGAVVEKSAPDKRLTEAQKLLDAITNPAQSNTQSTSSEIPAQ